MNKFISTILLLLFTYSVCAQPRMNYERKFEIGKPFASLYHATGWKKEGNQWYSALNEIKDLDHFNSYTFSLVDINNVIHLYLTVSYQHNNLDSTEWMDGMLLPLDDYKNQIRNLKADNTLRFHLTNYVHLIADVAGVKLKFGEIGKYSNYNLVMKFRFYGNNKTNFFFYVESSDNPTLSLHGDRNESVFLMLKENNEYNRTIKSDTLLDNFFYEVDTNKFLDFIQAPLNK